MREMGFFVGFAQLAHELVSVFRVLFGQERNQADQALVGRYVSALQQFFKPVPGALDVAVAKLQQREIQQRFVAIAIKLHPAAGKATISTSAHPMASPE